MKKEIRSSTLLADLRMSIGTLYPDDVESAYGRAVRQQAEWYWRVMAGDHGEALAQYNDWTLEVERLARLRRPSDHLNLLADVATARLIVHANKMRTEFALHGGLSLEGWRMFGDALLACWWIMRCRIRVARLRVRGR